MSRLHPDPQSVHSAQDTVLLTERQLLVRVEDMLHPGVPCNHPTWLTRIHGTLDMDRFARAFARLVAETPALRARVRLQGTEPFFVVGEHDSLALELVDLDPPQWEAWLQARVQRLFPDGGPLVDAALIRLGRNDYAFYLNQHHTITDSYSIKTLQLRLEAYYLGNAESIPTPSFLDYGRDDEAYRRSPEHAVDAEFWASRLTPPAPPLRPYGVSTHHKGALVERITFPLGPERSRRIRELAKAQVNADGACLSAFVLFKTALAAYLSRVCGTADVAFTTPVLNRTAEHRHTIGLLMQVVPVRVQVGETDTFMSLATQIAREALSAAPHNRHTVRFSSEVMLNVHSSVPTSFAGLPVESELTTPLNLLHALPSQAIQERWDGRESLCVQIHHGAGEGDFVCSFDLNRGTFADAGMRRRSVHHFVRVLDALLAQPQQSICDVDLVLPDERPLVLGTEARPPSDGRRTQPIYSRFAEQVQRSPTAPAVSFGDATLTYEQLNHRVNQLAHVLRERGVGPEALVGVFLSRSLDMLVGLLATFKVGGAYVPMDPHHPADRIGLILEDAAPHLVLTQTPLLAKLGAFRSRALCLDSAAADIAARPTSEPPVVSSDLAYVIFTSGSTGRPKGVQVRHHGLATFLDAMTERPGLRSGDRLLSVTTVSFDIAALELFLPLIVGATVHIADHETSMDARALRRVFESTPVTAFQATPATYRMLIENGWQGSPHLRLLVGGEALPYDLAQQLLTRAGEVWNMYGPTETTIWSSVEKLVPGEAVTIGRPIPGTRMYVLDANRRLVPVGVAGELWIAGDGVARGYHKRQDLTDERFLPDPYSPTIGERMYRTGDIARQLPDGRLECLGRVDFQVKIRGFRIELGEIETVLLRVPGCRQVVVSAHASGNSSDPRLVAYVVREPGEQTTATDLREHAKSKLPSYMVPSHFVFLEALPLTPNGKVDRKGLPAPETEVVAPAAELYVAPRSDLEEVVARIWGHVLGVPRVGAFDNFFDLGGNSILALRMTNEMERAFGATVPLSLAFEAPTVERFAAALCAGVATDFSVVALQPEGTGIPLFCICGIHLYQELADHLAPHHPVYGVFLRAEDRVLRAAERGERKSMPSVEELAATYLEAIRTRQARGPYALAGLSFGGALAFEIAHQMRAAGEKVAFVALFDTILPKAMRRAPLRWGLAHLRRLVTHGPQHEIAHLVCRIRTRLAELTRSTTLASFSSDRSGPQPPTNDDIAQIRTDIYVESMRAYQKHIRPSPDRVLLFRATKLEALFATGTVIKPGNGWRSLASLQEFDIPGDHLSILRSPGVDSIARQLKLWLDEADRASDASGASAIPPGADVGSRSV